MNKREKKIINKGSNLEKIKSNKKIVMCVQFEISFSGIFAVCGADDFL